MNSHLLRGNPALVNRERSELLLYTTLSKYVAPAARAFLGEMSHNKCYVKALSLSHTPAPCRMVSGGSAPGEKRGVPWEEESRKGISIENENKFSVSLKPVHRPAAEFSGGDHGKSSAMWKSSANEE